MKHTNLHAQEDHIQDPYEWQKKLREAASCPECKAVFHHGRWHWAPKPADSHTELCAACHRIRDEQPAGIVSLTGPFAREHRQEIIELARHQEEGREERASGGPHHGD